jgi:dihydropteroate synthase
MVEVVVEANASTILMHMQGTPDTMQKSPSYQNVVPEVYDWLKEAVDHAVDKGVREDLIIVDPGIGFGKTFDHNLQLLRNLEVFRQLKRPLLVGTSRKAFIGQILNLPADQRDEGTAATVAWSISKGVDIVRVHDVVTMKRVA